MSIRYESARWFTTRTNRRTIGSLVVLVFSALSVSLAFAQSRSAASALFESKQAQVYQIRVIDIASGDKAAIGSGFMVSGQGHIATNFHVVSDYVHEPDKFRLEYVAQDDETGPLKLLDIDVVHDLAIAQADVVPQGHFSLYEDTLAKGDRIYSMGNPHDLGMTIIEGTYNGLASISRYQKILFSGSLNPGMSGGPAMTADGQIMGVNVSTGGEQLSFLVPVSYLKILLTRTLEGEGVEDFQARIADALRADQDEFYGRFLDEALPVEAFGEFRLPAKLSDALKCWGHTVDDDDVEMYVASHRHCATEDEIFIRQDFYTGELFYDYQWITPGKLNTFQFYRAIETRFRQRGHYNLSDEDDASEYHCEDAFIALAEQSWKVSTCQRAYLEYEGLFDLLFLMSTVDMDDQAMIVRIGASGISAENAIRFLRRFMEAIQ